MNLIKEPGWAKRLNTEFEKTYFSALLDFLDSEYTCYTCYPRKEDIFKAFEYSPFDKTKVVIIGQDPYHDSGQANGLCFSVPSEIKHPPSLVNIFKELQVDVGMSYPASGDLTPWAKQGVLLLNATLTVRAHEAGSHQKKGWEKFTDHVIEAINKSSKSVVFLLWGGFAKKKKKLIDTDKHFILESGHPSPLSANRGYWFGNKHFTKTNSLLEQVAQQPIDWKLP